MFTCHCIEHLFHLNSSIYRYQIVCLVFDCLNVTCFSILTCAQVNQKSTKKTWLLLTNKTYIFIYLVIIIFIIDATVSGHLLALNASISNQSSISASVSILGLFPTFWFLLPWFLIWLSLNLLIKHLWFYDIIFVFKKLLVLIVGSHKVICKWFFVLVRAQRMTFIFIFWNNLIKLNHLWSICWCIIFMGTFMKRLVFIFVFNIIY